MVLIPGERYDIPLRAKVTGYVAPEGKIKLSLGGIGGMGQYGPTDQEIKEFPSGYGRAYKSLGAVTVRIPNAVEDADEVLLTAAGHGLYRLWNTMDSNVGV